MRVVSLIAVSLILIATAACLLALRAASGDHRGRLDPARREIVIESPARDRTPVSETAEVVFELTNPGRDPVRIHSVETGCGCSSASASPGVVEPGATSRVVVRVQPPGAQARTIPIRVHTDSASTPVVDLSVRLLGQESVPMLAGLGGRIGPGIGEEGRWAGGLSVHTIERGDDQVFEPSSDPDILEFSLNRVRRTETRNPGEIHKEYIFDVTLKGSDRGFTGTGDVTVVDPWNPGRSEHLVFTLERTSPLSVSPKRVEIDLARGAEDAVGRILIAAPRGISHLDLSLAGDAGNAPPIDHVIPDLSANPRVAVVEVRPAAGSAGRVLDEHDLLIRVGSAQVDREDRVVRLVLRRTP